MREGELEQVAKTAEETGAVLIIIDSFMAAFPGTNPSALTEVQGPLWYLRRLAEETGACVVLVDHLPKPLTGETAGARGVMGSVAKPAQSRAVHVLSAVPAKEVGGRKVLRWDVQKMSFGKLLEPFGVELEFDTRAHTVHVQTTDLPDTFAETKSDAAARAMQNYLEDNRNKPVPRKDLINVGIRGGGVGESTAKSALTQMLARLGDGVEEIVQAGKGAPKAYRLKPVGGDPPDVSNPLTQMGETPSQTNEHPGYTPLTEKDELTEIDDDERGYV